MDVLRKHVDSLFSKYKNTKEIIDLKNEILSNLQAKTADLSENGMDYNEAVNKAKESISGIDNLINGNTKVYINKFKLEYIQIILLYSLIGWILTIPIKVVGMGILLNLLFFISSIALGFYYFKLSGKKQEEYLNESAWLNINSACKIRKTVWCLWALFIAATFILITGVQFGSNIWFSRPVRISGPYQFAVTVIGYLLPALTIIVPIAASYAPKLIIKYEAVYENENQE